MSEWKDVLAPTPECIDVADFGDALDARSLAHLESCARCASELALFREMQQEGSPEENEAARWIAGELQRRAGESQNVVAFRPRSPRVFYAVAAAILLALGLGWWMQFREPSVSAIEPGGAYRSARLEVVAPIGDIAQPPNEMRWLPVPQATHYQIEIVEVDGTNLWSARTTEPHAALPPAVIAQFAPGKSLLWTVKAFRGNEMLASSETRKVRVTIP